MPPLAEQASRLEEAIARLEEQRGVLGDAVVDLTLTTLRSQLQAVRSQLRAARAPGPRVSPEQLLARLQSYLPKELAAKMRSSDRIESERKQVTVLFADINGFTALSERLDPEVVADLTSAALKELAEAVYQYEGYIDKFVGDAIMAVFGAPVAHEDDPDRALRTALAMRERLEAFNRREAERLDEPLTLHIGVNTGTVIAGNVGSDLRLSYTVMGDTVNTASRLEDAAQPGQILVSRDTYRLTAEAFTFQALEPITVKGKREPLTVYELGRARLHPGKARGLKDLGTTFVGREADLDVLRGVQAALETGQGRIVTITGEAGLGKSRLLSEWRAELGERGRYLEGRAFAHTTGLAYGPFLDLFRRVAGIRDEDSEAEARARLDRTMVRLFPDDIEAAALFANILAMRLTPEETAHLTPLRAEDLRARLFAHFDALLTRLAAARPVWLVIEDMHWADAASVELVEHLLALTERLPLAVVGVFRSHPDSTSRILQAVAEVSYGDRYIHLPLAILPDDSSLRMATQLLGMDPLSPALQALIVGKAEGNPFFVEEVLRSLIDRGALLRDESGTGWQTTDLIETVQVPDTLQGLLMSRLDRLPDETKWVVQQAAVIGRIFLYRVLLQMAGPLGGLEADLSHLEREELIRERARAPEVEYIFKHALTQEVAYNSLLAARRKELHRRAGEALEVVFADRLGEFQSVLAEHFRRAEAWERAVAYLVPAGDAAARLFAVREAAQHYQYALDALAQLPVSAETQRQRVDLLIKRVSVSLLADKPDENLARLAEAQALVSTGPGPAGPADPDPRQRAWIAFLLGRVCHYQNRMPEAIGHFRQVLALAADLGDPELLALPSSVIGQALSVQGRFTQAEALLRQAVASLDQIGNGPEWVRAAGYWGNALTAIGQWPAGRDAGQQCIQRALDLRSPPALLTARYVMSFNYMAAGQTQAALEEVRRVAELAQQHEQWVNLYAAYPVQAWAESRLGDHDGAQGSMARCDEMARQLGGRLILADVFAAIRAELAVNAGRYAEAIPLAAQALEVSRAAGGLLSESIAQRTWGQALAALDPPDWAAAESHLAAALTAAENGGNRMEAAHTHRAWSRLAARRGDAAAARAHRAQVAAQLAESGLDWPLD